jgi:hypothetical protein
VLRPWLPVSIVEIWLRDISPLRSFLVVLNPVPPLAKICPADSTDVSLRRSASLLIWALLLYSVPAKCTAEGRSVTYPISAPDAVKFPKLCLVWNCSSTVFFYLS